MLSQFVQYIESSRDEGNVPKIMGGFFRTLLVSITLFAGFVGQSALAQTIPQLASPITLSGIPTTAQFFAGARASVGGFASELELDGSPELLVSVSPESSHIGSSGKLYVLAIAGNVPFSLLENGAWQSFDGTVEGLGGAQSLVSLASANELSITSIGELFNRPGVVINNGAVNYSVFVAYDTSANPGQLYFSGAPLSFTLRDLSLLKSTNLPELATPATLTGTSTSARFFGGAAPKGAQSFPAMFDNADDISVQFEILPEVSHVGAAGNSYVLAIVGGVQFSLTSNGTWQLFDGTVPGLGLAENYSALASSQVLTVDSVISLIGNSGVATTNGSVQFLVFAAYDTAAKPGELFFSGTPAAFNVMNQPTVSALELFQTSIEQQIIQQRCVVCHTAGQIAGSSALVYQSSSATSATFNFAQFESFVATRSDAKDYILTNSTGGLGHLGGAQLNSNSADYANFSAFLDALIAGQ